MMHLKWQDIADEIQWLRSETVCFNWYKFVCVLIYHAEARTWNTQTKIFLDAVLNLCISMLESSCLAKEVLTLSLLLGQALFCVYFSRLHIFNILAVIIRV